MQIIPMIISEAHSEKGRPNFLFVALKLLIRVEFDGVEFDRPSKKRTYRVQQKDST